MKMKRLIIPLIIAAALGVGSGSVAFAARNPAGQGQPGVECEDDATMPPGFLTGGFGHAETVYAGSEDSASLLHSHSDHAVSQYDIACYQTN